mmetsp:Transcript_26362/g.74134  ORF Transcript_26362/g.74134 Transcript_26362/m.74134 type:complete len:103 (-) Transcript_26362:69-377(-)
MAAPSRRFGSGTAPPAVQRRSPKILPNQSGEMAAALRTALASLLSHQVAKEPCRPLLWSPPPRSGGAKRPEKPRCKLQHAWLNTKGEELPALPITFDMDRFS